MYHIDERSWVKVNNFRCSYYVLERTSDFGTFYFRCSSPNLLVSTKSKFRVNIHEYLYYHLDIITSKDQ